jgi:hypothetical protein
LRTTDGRRVPILPDVLVGVETLPTFEIAERRAQHGDLDALREIDAGAVLVDQPEPMMTRWIYTGRAPKAGSRKSWRSVRAVGTREPGPPAQRKNQSRDATTRGGRARKCS